MPGGPLCGSEAFTWIVALSIVPCIVGSLGGCALVGTPGCENLLHKEDCALLLQQRLAPNRASERGDICSDGIKTSEE